MVASGVMRIRGRLAARFLTDICHIEREVAGNAPFAGSKQTLPVTNSVACRLIMKSGSNNDNADMVGGREVLANEYELILPHDQAIEIDYRVTIGENKYQVQRVVGDLTDKTFKKVAIRSV